MSLLAVSSLAKSFGERRLLPIDTLNAGRSYVLTGENGSGKSTLLRRVLKPQVLPLDELTANLDSEWRAQTIDLLRGFCAEQTTAVIPCHDRDVIELPDMQRLHLVDHTLGQALPPTS